jgi:GMP synthase-like glutamine amidotransferase
MARVLTIAHPGGGDSGVFAEAAAAERHEIEEWTPALSPAPPRAPGEYDALVVLGGEQNVCEQDVYPYLVSELEFISAWIEGERPLLGVCLGAQLLAEAAGGTVVRSAPRELGWYDVELTAAGSDDSVLGFGAPRFSAFEWHDYEAQPPPGATALARSATSLQAFRLGSAWGVQFHPEVTREIVEEWIAESRDGGDDAPAGAFADLSSRLQPWMAYGRELFSRFAAQAG